MFVEMRIRRYTYDNNNIIVYSVSSSVPTGVSSVDTTLLNRPGVINIAWVTDDYSVLDPIKL